MDEKLLLVNIKDIIRGYSKQWVEDLRAMKLTNR